MKTYTVQEALLKLYNNTRKAPLTVDEHDENRACVDVIAQALNLSIQWTVPTEEKKDDAPLTNTTAPSNPSVEPVKSANEPVLPKAKKRFV